jgi:hypothetical protein
LIHSDHCRGLKHHVLPIVSNCRRLLFLPSGEIPCRGSFSNVAIDTLWCEAGSRLQVIEESCFSGCSFRCVCLSGSIQRIDGGCSSSCKQLGRVELEEGPYPYYSYLRSIGSAILEGEFIGQVWLFHQIDRQCADGILRSMAMYPGRGMFGAGIYFAEDRRTTNTNTHRLGMMIKARVAIGMALVLREAENAFDASCL